MEADQTVIVTVKDNGIGIRADHQNRIFKRFFRVDEHRPSGGSSGPGLSIARLIVELHGGQIEVDSIPDEGSEFRVILQKL